ncbi:sensor histidine kinase [Desulfuromonas versatilis]|uniref:histidine kinase n=1 Tax=Desulfuromonas versatilis TaxID=2802975 RepID=A0ABM8HY58_9BACT|nr:ATP-binding protein [Desulfuromonas versatilis]BCR05521.1 sensor histidine kinase [Desulfuromonas versatilis]
MRRQDWIRLTILLGMILGITALHYLTATQEVFFHDIYRRLYYIPIVLGGLWFNLRGGIAAAIGISVLYAPHVVFQWGHHPTTDVEQYLEILLYNIIGFLTGFLSQRELTQKLRYQRTAQHLEESYGKLREQADLILEIEEQLRRADRLSALGELSAGMAHEIRNPLGSIRGTAEILRDGIDPADKRYEFSQILIKEVDRLNRVVQEFLEFARPASPERGVVSVNEALREVLTLTAQQALKAAVEVHFEAEEIPRLAGNQEQLKQAFLNLVLNALQAMPGGGVLSVRTHCEAKLATIEFTDTGQGIPAENLQRIFNPFFTTRRDGTGLGLAITHRIIQGHGGRIQAQSRLGEGTRFLIHIPID